MKRMISILSLLLLCHFLVAQQQLINITYEDYDGNLSRTIFIENSRYCIFGTGNASQINGRNAVKMVKTDHLGVLDEVKFFGDSLRDSNASVTIKLRQDNSYISFGFICNPNFDCKGLILKQGPNGDSIWSRIYGLNGIGLFYHGMELKNGDLIATGRFSLNGAPEQMWVVKVDDSGNLKWQKTYGGSNFEESTTILQAQDEGFLLFGSTDSYGNGLKDAYVVKIDSAGNLEWQKTYGTTWNEYSVEGAYASDGGYYLWGVAQDEDVINGFPTYEKITYIKKIDQAGNFIWNKVVHRDFSRWAYINHLKEAENGKIILVGEKDSLGTSLNYGWVAKLDTIGNDIWERYYLNPDNNKLGAWLQDFKLGNDGEIICAGGGNVPGSVFANKINFWLLVLDSMGCLVPGCDSLVGLENVATTTLQAKLYPNPTTGTLTIELPNAQGGSIALYNLLGQSVYQSPLNGRQTTIDINLPPGLYLYRITSGGKAVNGKLLVE